MDWPVLPQSARKASSPLSVNGCLTRALKTSAGRVAASAPARAAAETWAGLRRLAARTGVGMAGLLRKKEADAKALLDAGADDEAIIAAAIAQPILIERPIAETAKGAVIGRPVERVLDVL